MKCDLMIVTTDEYCYENFVCNGCGRKYQSGEKLICGVMRSAGIGFELCKDCIEFAYDLLRKSEVNMNEREKTINAIDQKLPEVIEVIEEEEDIEIVLNDEMWGYPV